MTIRFWGVRGSYPVPGADTARYGGNTSCVEVRLNDGTHIILDAGSGIRPLGHALMEGAFGQGVGEAHLLISHTHWDHIMGFPFFEPANVSGNRLTIWGRKREGYPLKDVFAGQQVFPFSNRPFDNFKADLEFKEILEGEPFSVGGAKVIAVHLNHPFHDLGYRIEADGKILSYVTDTSPYEDILLEDEFVKDPNDAMPAIGTPAAERQQACYDSVIESLKDADLAIYDTFFEPEGYESRPHWGHSTPVHAIESCKKAGVKCLALFHHAPDNTDAAMDDVVAKYQGEVSSDPLEVLGAREGEELTL
ncbi:MAG: MBL fold metallo-hydrolase [Candidatus Latescibacteria bacterium]|nr:MBL fold metallo-hydrolase [Candidatus Latescibacterota bacterium]